jgi:integrase
MIWCKFARKFISDCKVDSMDHDPLVPLRDGIAKFPKILTTKQLKRHPTSQTKILAAKPGRYYYGHGLCLVVTAGKRRTKPKWIFRYTKPSTKKVSETTIGSAYGWTYHDAAYEAARLRAFVAKGQDPVQVKQQAKSKGITYAEACEAFIKHHARRWRSTRNVKNLLGQAKGLDAIPMSTITPPMIKEALMPVWEKHPYQVIRSLPMIASVFRYAKFMNWCSGENPADWKGNMENVFGGLKRRENHHASLPFKDVPDLIRRLRSRQVRGTAAAMLEFQILTATRGGEARGARWTEISVHDATWVIPRERMKEDREHRVPLSKRCLELLAVQQEYRTTEFVFTGRHKKQMDETATRVLLKTMGVPVAPHGFRSSFRNWAFTTRQDRDLAELSLSHIITNKVEGAYLTIDGLDERRPLMEQWSLFCAGT